MNWTKIIITALVAYALYTTFVVREGFGTAGDIIGLLAGVMIIGLIIQVLYFWFST